MKASLDAADPSAEAQSADDPVANDAPSPEQLESQIRSAFFEAVSAKSRELQLSDRKQLGDELCVLGNYLRNGLPRRPGSETIEALLDNIQKAQSLTRGIQDSFELLDFELLGHLRILVESYRLQKRDREWGTFSAITLIVEQEMRRNAQIGDSHPAAKLLAEMLVSTQLTAVLQKFPEEHKPDAKELLGCLIEAAEAAGADGLGPAFAALLAQLTPAE